MTKMILLLACLFSGQLSADQETTRLFGGLAPVTLISVSPDHRLVYLQLGLLEKNCAFLRIGPKVICETSTLGLPPDAPQALDGRFVILEADFEALSRCVETTAADFQVGKKRYLIWKARYLEISPSVQLRRITSLSISK
jgi:hypothetical protein